LLKANHKTEYVKLDGLVQPIKVDPGQFITGRFQLHGEYHGWRKGYKKRSPSPFTVWRWLHFLEKMQNLSIKSFNKYSIISITNWNLYQENEQQMSNRRSTGEHKQEGIKNDRDSMAPKRKKGKEKPNPVRSFILEWGEMWAQKFGNPYTVSWAKEGALVKGMLGVHSLQELEKLKGEFFSSTDPYIQGSDYSIGFFKTQLNKLIRRRKAESMMNNFGQPIE